ncbi:glycosyltransferase [Glutamicibacter creatinolyticus]|uniref:glycosyltransferase n=1 Tax=Glutamicibacter creatinolyticus TaxID=162496 RepID=UPI0037BE95B4
MSRQFTVMVSAGTYHLPFERLGNWIGQWARKNPGVKVIYQHGPGTPIEGADNRVILPVDELMDLFSSADAVVLQGGAGGVMDLRALQRIPIVVPRRPELNEVVDTHQLLFTDQASKLGLIHRADDAQTLFGLLDQAVQGLLPTRSRASERTEGITNGLAVLDVLPEAIGWSTTLRRMTRSIVPILRSIR